MYIKATDFFKSVYSIYGSESRTYLQNLVFALEYVLALKNGTASLDFMDNLRGSIPVVVNLEELKKKL